MTRSENRITSSLWTERYRPRTLDDLVMEADVKAKFAEIIAQGDAPNMLFFGKQGTGKTTLAKILISCLDCEHIEMNSSLSRGIDAVRGRVVNFAVMRGNARWRIILMEEADGLTPDAQDSLRNLMETYSGRMRIILTANYINRIIAPIRSRCQVVEFKELPRKECMRQLQNILKQEAVKYDEDTVLQIIDSCYPDMRSMIQTLQLSTVDKALKEIKGDVSESITVMSMLKKKDLDGIRSISYRLDMIGVYRYIFDHIEEIEKDTIKRAEKRLAIAEFMWKDGSIADREINFAAMCLMLMK
jgi:DNA polymerase III delta prime subunit